MRFVAFDKQVEFHRSEARIRGAFAGKRGGKTESGAIESIKYSENQIGFKSNGVDPYIGAIIAPTKDMLRRLSMAKFMAYAKPFVKKFNKSTQEATWHNDSIIYGLSADEPQRIEGLKLSWVWIDEVFQVSEQLFLEAMARVSDTKGAIWCTGSLGIQYVNPKMHWAYKYFKERPLDGSKIFEWTTAENPYFPQDELRRLKETLDPKTFKQMFTIDWDVPAKNVVYDTFSDPENVLDHYQYDSRLPTYVCIDWGYAHPMACGFFQYDPRSEKVILFDEIVSSRLTIEELYNRIISKGYGITDWYCDIAGTQERETTGYSNVRYFREKHNIHFKYRSTAITEGISVMRPWVKDGLGRRKFYIVRNACPKSLDGIKNYKYQEKNGEILNENPLKKDDDCADMIRYFFVNRFDPRFNKPQVENFNRWGTIKI